MASTAARQQPGAVFRTAEAVRGMPAMVLLRPAAVPAAPTAPRRQRTRLWELNASIHCSIIGTCLTTAELRRVLAKVLPGDCASRSDHDLHSEAVGLCTHRNTASKLLQKALDQQHETVVKRLGRLEGEAAVLEAWAGYRRAGDIPGAYWAVLTHPDTGHHGLRRAFGDVHMLSHLVGAANRADIRRLTLLEEENAALRAKVERQQQRMHEAVTARDARIRQLGALVAAPAEAPGPDLQPGGDEAAATLRSLLAEMQCRLERETARRERLEARVAAAAEAERRARSAAAEADALRRELELLERTLGGTGAAPSRPLAPRRVLYVGGRPAATGAMRTMLAEAGGALLTHDGGRHDHPSLLPGLIDQAELVVFPVDCVSHDAALTVKRVCRQLGTRFVPLRSSGLASFLAAAGAPAAGEDPPIPLPTCLCTRC